MLLTSNFFSDTKVIPKSCSIIISIYNIHRDKRHWERPNEFYPDHFSSEAVRQRHPYAFMPFSAGPRGCLGEKNTFFYYLLQLVYKKVYYKKLGGRGVLFLV